MSVATVKPIILNADNGLLHNNTLYVNFNERNSNYNSSNNNSRNNFETTNSSNSTNDNYDKSKTSNHRPIIYKFFVPRYVDVVGLHFGILRACNQCQAITINVQANAVPTTKKFIHNAIIYANKTDETIVDFYPQQNVWHYIEIGFVGQRNTDGSIVSSTISPSIKSIKSKSRIEKKFQYMGSNNSVNFTIGLHFTNEIVTIERNEYGSNENKSINNTNNIKNNSSNRVDEHSTMQFENRTGNHTTNNTDSFSVDDQNSTETVTTTETGTTTTTNIQNQNEIDDFNDTEFETTATAKLSGKPRNINYYSLLRQTYREFFMFDYDLLPDDNGSVPTFINLTASTPTGFRFNVGNVYDIGGTLSFAVVMKDNLRDASIAAAASSTMARNKANRISDVAVAEKLVHVNEKLSDVIESRSNSIEGIDLELNHLRDDDDDIDSNPSRSNQTIIICMRLGEPGNLIMQNYLKYS